MQSDSSNNWFETAFREQPLMAILRGLEPDRAVETARRAWDLGIDWVEVPIQSADGLDALAAVAEAARARDRTVGAGTVTTAERVRQAARAGARFAVAPGLDPDVATASLDAGLPYLPGVSTPSEIQVADRIGLRWLKVFPASVLGPGWIKAMHGPFPLARFVATGGIDASSAARYLDAGAAVIGVGSALEDPGQIGKLADLLRKRE
ncbi:MAG: bifunctional 4-hydroxy-2-oxoglutarate aldolase/2-dehydro-3-deoxy-phosphogluconate aldolase [Streptosporangiales bacterium]|nr:bifunctional 4-hydroxy-2-oxoglutarate aldolase/2-dehydro-3-deoxy-phosphogluconate aldolase [Streptosporangiales bacterium]